MPGLDADRPSREERDETTNTNEAMRESGRPGGGAGRREDVRGSGVYPASGPWPEGDATFRGEASWGQGERGAAGYEDHGTSETMTIRPDGEQEPNPAIGSDTNQS